MPREARVGRFASEKARRRYLDAYDEAMGRMWPRPREESDVDTRFGTTRVHRYGDGTGPGVVLLHGWNGSALSWYGGVAALAVRHPVYAVDTLGDAGRSVQRAPIATPEDSAAWLDEVLAGLGLSGAHLVGESYGGWLALNQAIRAPGRVASVSLVDPAGLAPIRPRFYAWLIACGLAAIAPGGVRRRAARWLGNGVLNEPDLLRFGLLVRGFRMGLVPPRPLGDAELRAVARPVLLLVGERSAMHDAARLVARARTLVPDVSAVVVPGAGHGLRFDRPDLVHGRIVEFLVTAEPGGRRAAGG